jgi:hypothetical protein
MTQSRGHLLRALVHTGLPSIAIIVFVAVAFGARAASVPNPTVSGPIASPDIPGTPTAPSTCSIGVTEFASPAMGSKNLLPTHTADFGPDLEFFGPGSSVLGGSDMIAAKVEEVIDLIMG